LGESCLIKKCLIWKPKLIDCCWQSLHLC